MRTLATDTPDMSTVVSFALEFSHLQVNEISKYQELCIRISLDGTVQESLESTLAAGIHTWREPFSFAANSLSQCEIHVLAKKRKFLCYAGRYKTIRTTRLQCIDELLGTRSTHGAIRLPLFDSTKTDLNGATMGSIEFLIAEACESLSYPEAGPEKLSFVESESDGPTSPPPRPNAPTPPASPPTLSPILCPPKIHPVPVPSRNTPQYLRTTTQLPQSGFAYSPQKSGVDRFPARMDANGDAPLRPMYVASPGMLADDTMTAASSLVDEDNMSGLSPRGSAEIGSFTPVICEPPEDITFEGSDPDMTRPTSFSTPEHGTIPQISITLTKSSRGNSPLAPSCESDNTVKRPSVHVNTGSASQSTGVTSAHSVFPGVDELSPFSRSAGLASPQPTTATTNPSSAGLSPFSRTSAGESPSTTATTPAQSAISEGHKDSLLSSPKPRKDRPTMTIDTSVAGPRGQVRKYRNGSVPPVHVPVKLRNASLDLPRAPEYERFEPNPSMHSIAPSVSPRRAQRSGDLRSQPPASRQTLAPSTRAPSIRRETLEFDEAQICLDTANLGDQEVATFLKEVDAALTAIVNGSPAVAADSHAFLAVPGATSRVVSRHQSRKPSSQHLRADLSATIRTHEKEGAARTGFSLVATARQPLHPDVMSSRVASPLSGHTDTIPRLFLSQVDAMTGSTPGSPSRNVLPVPTFPLPHRVSPQPSPRQELVEWMSPSFVSSISTRGRQLSRAGSFNGNESIPEAV